MPATPKFRINDVVYLVESAALGELEAYRIGALRQHTDGDWIYDIYIDQKPPAEQTVGDRIDLKTTVDASFHESDLATLCEALNIAIYNVQSRINRYSNIYTTECGASIDITGTSMPTTGTDMTTGTGTDHIPPLVPSSSGTSTKPKFSIGQTVYVRSSAQIGFLEPHIVTNIHMAPTASEFVYQLDLTTVKNVYRPITGTIIYFKERELLNKCDALRFAISALNSKMMRFLGLKLAHCI
ncbi:MAG: hypothetical protein QXP41_00610 [Candidatus Nitrosocaldus sp.]